MNTVAYIDHLLRNREEVVADLRDEKKVRQSISACFLIFVALSVFYGFVMGAHNLVHGYRDGWEYALAAAVKLPMLFLFTLAICLPLLYVLNVLIGPRARFSIVLGHLLTSIAVTSIVLASCAPILAFFMLSTKSYAFIKLLNVAIFTLAGAYGVWYLGKGMNEMAESAADEDVPIKTSRSTATIMKWWLVTYGTVGTQMAWLLRPYIGSPSMPFSFFRPQESNFFENLAHTIGKLMGM